MRGVRWAGHWGALLLASLTFSCGGDGDAGGNGLRPHDPPDIDLPTVARQVRVELPGARQVQPGFTVENSHAAAPLEGDGQVELEAFDGGPQLTALVTPAGNAMFLGWIDAEQDTLSARTTAEVLLYQQLGVWLLPNSETGRARELIRETAELDAVEQAIATAVAADPDALADGEPTVTAALEEVVGSLKDQGQSRSLLIDPSEAKSGIEVLHGEGLNTYQIKNSYRRRAHAWLMRVEYIPAGGGSPVPSFATIRDFPIGAVTGAKELLSTLADMVTGDWAWEPVVLPAEVLPREPADARSTTYELMTVGAGLGEGEMDRLTEAQKAKRTQVVRYQFVVDFIVPMFANIMLPAGSRQIDDYLGWINGSAVVEDLVNLLGREIPGLWLSVEQGQVGLAVQDAIKAIAASETLRLVFLQAIWEGLFQKAGIAQANRFGAIAERAMVVLTAVDLGLTAIDSIIQAAHWASSNGADSWNLTVTASTVTLLPAESFLPSNRIVRLTANIPNTRERQVATQAYHFTCTGRAGTISNDRHTAALEFESSLPWVDYTPTGDTGADETVSVTVTQKLGTTTEPVGQATATVHVVHLWLDPASPTITANNRPTINLSVMNDPGPYRVEWRVTNGRISADGDGWATRVEHNATSIYYGRGTGAEGAAEVTCTAYHDDGEASYLLGTVICPITLEAYAVPAELKGYATIIPNQFVGASYGCEFEKVLDATGYTIEGTGFNDPLAYGTRYRGTIPPLDPNDKDLGDRYYKSFTAGGGSWNPDVTEAELIADFAWRFAGGTFWATPHFF